MLHELFQKRSIGGGGVASTRAATRSHRRKKKQRRRKLRQNELSKLLEERMDAIIAQKSNSSSAPPLDAWRPPLTASRAPLTASRALLPASLCSANYTKDGKSAAQAHRTTLSSIPSFQHATPFSVCLLEIQFHLSWSQPEKLKAAVCGHPAARHSHNNIPRTARHVLVHKAVTG